MVNNILQRIDAFQNDSSILAASLPERIDSLRNARVENSLILLLEQVQTQFNDLITRINSIDSYLAILLDALDPSQHTTLAEWEAALNLFGVTLSVASDGLGQNDTGWSQGNGIRAERAYLAAQRIIYRIGGISSDEEKLRGILQFLDTFEGTNLQLTQRRTSGDTPYAETQNPGGNIIYLYTDPDTLWLQEDIDRGYIAHTPENVIHEFGHVLVFRNGADNSGIYEEWNGIRNYIDPFDTTLGWTPENFNRLQNKARLGDLPSNELEHERIANMFEASVTGYQPNIAPQPFEERESRAAWAMWTFMTGTPPPYDPTALDDPQKTVWIDATRSNRPVGNSLMYWLTLYGSET